ncbi:MAG: polysaccharide deacetylase family protein [Erythrobacter sp.]
MTTGSTLQVPPAGQTAAFASGFGQRVLLTVDTEEEFDWRGPFRREGYGLSHIEEIPRFQAVCERIGAHPVYLVDWPVVQHARAVEIIGAAVERGAAEVGIQLHPWVNPPFEEEVSVHNSFAGNLPRPLEAAKLMALRDATQAAFGTAPMIYRAGRYGLGSDTAALLKRAGIRIDTSVRPLFDYSLEGGPDYSNHPLLPYWLDAEQSLLEVPLTSAYWGLLRRMGSLIHRAKPRLPRFFSGLSRLGLLERIALTPEGVSPDEALRGIDLSIEAGLPVLVLSLHSPTLAPGHTPYTTDQAGVEKLYLWLETVYGRLAARGVTSCTVAEIIAATGG